MKKYYPGTALALAFCIRLVLIAVVILASAFLFGGYAQQGLVFKNPVLTSGTAGQNGAVYRFPTVTANVDALVTINGRSNGLVKLVNIDLSTVGHDKAFQPQVTYNNNTTPGGTSDWWMEFNIAFVKNGTTTPVSVSAFDITAVDIDGNGDRLYEWVCFYDLKTSMFESNTLLQSITLLDYILGLLTPVGKKFNGPERNFVDVDTSATTVMATTHYENKGQFKMRVGGHSTGSPQGAADRMYSFWFKTFTYQAPVQSTLPVKLASFNAIKKDTKVALTWSTSMEKNVSHFTIQRSIDGADYTDVGMIFTDGDSDLQRDYAFSDDVKNINKQVYYRLKIVDLDGKYEHSPVRVIRTGSQSETPTVLAYPNPVTDNLRITLPSSWQDNKVTIDVVNANGQILKRVTNNRASQTETLDVRDLAVGLYMVRVSNGSETAIQRIVKSK